MADQNHRPHPLFERTVAVVLPVLYDLTWAKDVHVMLGMCGYCLASWHRVSYPAVMEALAEQLVADLGESGPMTHDAVARAAALTHTRFAFALTDWPPAAAPAPAAPPAAAPAAPPDPANTVGNFFINPPPLKLAKRKTAKRAAHHDTDDLVDDTRALDFDRTLRRKPQAHTYKPTTAGLAIVTQHGCNGGWMQGKGMESDNLGRALDMEGNDQ